jgi:DNA-binding NarL/FixJ family response regulator
MHERVQGMSATIIAPSAFNRRVRSRRLTLVRDDAECTQARDAVATHDIRVLVAGQALTRTGFRMLLETESGIAVAGEAATGEEAVAIAGRTRPDVVLMGTCLPGLDIVEATRRITVLPEPRVMLVSHSAHGDVMFEVLRAGASGILVSDTDPTELVRAVRALARGDAVLSPAFTRRVIARLVTAE